MDNQAGGRCSWICWVALAKEEPTTCVVLGLQCFLRCKSFQLIQTSGAPGDVPQDDFYLPLADTALRATNINPAGGGSQPLPPGWGERPGPGSSALPLCSWGKVEAGAAEDEYGGIALIFIPSRPWKSQV